MTQHEPAAGGEPQARGRLVLVLEQNLSAASRVTLRGLLHDMHWEDDVTMVSGLSRATVLQAGHMCDGLFYNRREYLPPEEAFMLMPWREIWLVANGRIWQMNALH